MTYTKTLNVELNKQGADGKNAITMTSATTPNGEYNGQIGIWQGQVYQWDGTSWVLTSGILPTDPVLHYSFDDLPDLPDGTSKLCITSGNTYETMKNWNKNYTTETPPTITNNNGNIVVTTNGANQGIFKGYLIENYEFLKIKIKLTQGYINFLGIEGLDSIGGVSVVSGEYIFKGDGTHRAVVIYGSQNCIFEVESIYIGEAKYITPIIDNTGNNNHASIINILSTKGLSGKCGYNKGGMSSYVTRENLKLATATYTIWFKTENSQNGQWNIVNDGSPSGSEGVRIGGYDGDNVGFFTPSTGWKSFNLNINNEWQHIAIVFDKKNNIIKCYYNGKLENTFDGILTFGNSKHLDIGGTRINASYNRTAFFDDFMLFDRPLTDQEVLGLYLAKGNTPKQFTINDYRLNLIDDDGVISVSEKKELLRRWKEIYNSENVSTALPTSNITANGEYKAVIDSANSLNIGNITAIINYRESANALRDAFWGAGGYLNNMANASTINGSLDSLFANYKEALQNANNAISDQQSAQASAITVQMASPFVQLPVNDSGSVTSYDNSGNVITVLNGAVTLTPVTATTTLSDNQYSVSASGSGITAGTVSVDTTNKKVTIGNSTAMTKPNAQITYTIKFRINGTTGTLYAQQKISTASRGADGKRGPMYRGTTKPTTDVVYGDWYLDTTDNLIHVYNNSNWNTTVTNYNDYRYTPALNDMLAIAAEQPDVGFIKITTAHIQNLAAGNILANVLTTKELKLTGNGVIKSENYGETTGGFEIKANGQATFANVETPIVLTSGNICFMRCMDISSYGSTSNETLSVEFETNSQGEFSVEVQLFDLGGSTTGTTFSGTLKIDESPITINNVYSYKTTVTRPTTKGTTHSVKFELTGKSRTYPVVMVVSLGEGNLSKTSWGYKQLVENVIVKTKTFCPDGSYSWNLFFTPSRISAKTNINVAKSYAGTKDGEKNLVMPFFQNYPRNGTFPEFFATTPLCYGHGAISGLYNSSNTGTFGGYTVYLPVFWANKNQEATIFVNKVSVLIEGKWNNLNLGTNFYL